MDFFNFNPQLPNLVLSASEALETSLFLFKDNTPMLPPIPSSKNNREWDTLSDWLWGNLNIFLKFLLKCWISISSYIPNWPSDEPSPFTSDAPTLPPIPSRNTKHERDNLSDWIWRNFNMLLNYLSTCWITISSKIPSWLSDFWKWLWDYYKGSDLDSDTNAGDITEWIAAEGRLRGGLKWAGRHKESLRTALVWLVIFLAVYLWIQS
ncbi:uncharacterized protein BDV14DRAFT_196156 [Aspergillus stella-maris]|uniref:uncharacterized protein n=1 Tax=Aspergillus stella-maris TaxID=1810926 RepID=UPI003CCDBAC8